MFIKWVKISKKNTINSNSIGLWKCDSCNAKYKRIKKTSDKTSKNPAYNGLDVCRKCYSKFINTTEKYRKTQSNAQKLSYKENPNRSIQLSKTCIKRKINVGNKNGMKKMSARKKVSDFRRNMPKYLRKIYSNANKKAWADGKFDDVKVGRCKWYTLNTPHGKIKLQGTWELKYAKYLMDNNIEFFSHRGRIAYLDDNNESHSYYPDFYIPAENKYIDIKAPYFYELHKNKFSCIRNQHPELCIKILTLKISTNTWEEIL